MRKDAIISLIERYHENKPRFFSLASLSSPLEYLQKVSDSQTKAEEQLIQLLESFMESESIKTREDDSQITLREVKLYFEQQNRSAWYNYFFSEKYYLSSQTIVATLIKQMADAEKRSPDYGNLNKDVWLEISSHLDLKSINALSATSFTYFYLIKEYDRFWQKQLVKLGYYENFIAALIKSKKISHYKNLYKSSHQYRKKEKLPTTLTEMIYFSGEPLAVLHYEEKSRAGEYRQLDFKRKAQLVGVSGSASAIKLMIEHNAIKNYRALNYFAALSGNVMAMKEAKKAIPFIAASSEGKEGAGRDRDYLLEYAVLSGSVSAVNEAIARGGNPFYINDGKTLLHFAIESGNPRMVEEVKKHLNDLKNVWDLPGYNEHSQRPLIAAAMKTKNDAIVLAVLSLYESVEAGEYRFEHYHIHENIGSYSVSVVQALMDKDLDIKNIDQFGNSALFYAAREGNIPLMRALFSGGLNNPTRLNSKQENILHQVAKSLNVEAILFVRKYLHEKKIPIDSSMTSSEGLDAFQTAEFKVSLRLTDLPENSKEKEMLEKQLEEVKDALTLPIETLLPDISNNIAGTRPSY